MKWISTEEKLPKENQPVLLFTPFEFFGELHSCVGDSESIKTCTIASSRGETPIFTHWVSLPENPCMSNRRCDK